MKILDRKKILRFMTKRKDSLYGELTRDFGGGTGGKLWEQREVKYWKEAIERGEFDTELMEVYIILSVKTQKIADMTFYTSMDDVLKRLEIMNLGLNHRGYWYISLYSYSGEHAIELGEA